MILSRLCHANIILPKEIYRLFRKLFVVFKKYKSSQNEEGNEDYISSVSWIKEGNILAVGDSQAEIQLW